VRGVPRTTSVRKTQAEQQALRHDGRNCLWRVRRTAGARVQQQSCGVVGAHAPRAIFSLAELHPSRVRGKAVAITGGGWCAVLGEHRWSSRRAAAQALCAP
jgi:hypothetical protein